MYNISYIKADTQVLHIVPDIAKVVTFYKKIRRLAIHRNLQNSHSS